jgi:hypothetical protein
MDFSARELYKLRVDEDTLHKKSVLLTKNVTPLSRERVLDWICFVYHPNTPMKMYNSRMKMKMESALIANFKRDENGEFTKKYEDVILGKNPVVNLMIIEYLKMFNNPDYMELVIFKEQFEDELYKMTNMIEEEGAKPKDIKDIRDAREKSIDLQAKLKRRIKELERTFLDQEDNKMLLASLYQEMELSKLGITPEEIAAALKDKKDPLFGYKPEML